jgi:hypothetical protein
LAQGDLNGDGIADLVVPLVAFLSPTPNFEVLIGNKDGSFRAPVLFPTGTTTGQRAALIADFNHDGKNDVALTTNLGVSALLGDGNGGLGAPHIFAAHSPAALAVADFNGDGKLDLAVPDASSNNVSVLLGKGDGTFGSRLTPPRARNRLELPWGTLTETHGQTSR